MPKVGVEDATREESSSPLEDCAGPSKTTTVKGTTLMEGTEGTEENSMSNDPDKVWPTGLTLREAEEVHSYLIDGTRVFGVIALIAHILVAVSTPWLG